MFDDKFFCRKAFLHPLNQPYSTPIHLIRVVCYIRNTFSGFAVHSIAILSLTGSNPCEWKSAKKKRVEFDVFREDFKRFSNFFLLRLPKMKIRVPVRTDLELFSNHRFHFTFTVEENRIRLDARKLGRKFKHTQKMLNSIFLDISLCILFKSYWTNNSFFFLRKCRKIIVRRHRRRVWIHFTSFAVIARRCVCFPALESFATLESQPSGDSGKNYSTFANENTGSQAVRKPVRWSEKMAVLHRHNEYTRIMKATMTTESLLFLLISSSLVCFPASLSCTR